MKTFNEDTYIISLITKIIAFILVCCVIDISTKMPVQNSESVTKTEIKEIHT